MQLMGKTDEVPCKVMHHYTNIQYFFHLEDKRCISGFHVQKVLNCIVQIIVYVLVLPRTEIFFNFCFPSPSPNPLIRFRRGELNCIQAMISPRYDYQMSSSNLLIKLALGGEACLISAAGSVWGIGSDIGGSIRYSRSRLDLR